MIHTRKDKIKYQCLNNSTLIDIILDKEDELYSANQVINELLDVHKENDKLKRQLEYLRSGEYLNQVKWERDYNEKLVEDYSTKLRHIEQYFDDLDDIDYKTIKYEVEKILNE